jgi:hypothetical protein
MRYVAVSQPSPWSPMEIVGVGETMEEAYAGARAWFENAFDKFGDQRWNELVAMQNNLNAVPEAVLHERTGATLDEWLVRLANLGQYPGTPQPPKPPRSPAVTRVRSGWETSVWIVAGILVAFYPCSWLVTRIWTDIRHGSLSDDILTLPFAFLLALVISAAWSAFWFWVYRWFRSDATLQDFLFFLLMLKIAALVAGFFFPDVGLMGIPVLGFS